MLLAPVTIKPTNVPCSLASKYFYVVCICMCFFNTPQGKLRKVKVKTIIYLCFYNLLLECTVIPVHEGFVMRASTDIKSADAYYS